MTPEKIREIEKALADLFPWYTANSFGHECLHKEDPVAYGDGSGHGWWLDRIEGASVFIGRRDMTGVDWRKTKERWRERQGEQIVCQEDETGGDGIGKPLPGFETTKERRR